MAQPPAGPPSKRKRERWREGGHMKEPLFGVGEKPCWNTLDVNDVCVNFLLLRLPALLCARRQLSMHMQCILGMVLMASCTSGTGSQSQCGSCSCLPWNQEFDDCTSGEATIPEFHSTQPGTIKCLLRVQTSFINVYRGSREVWEILSTS